MSLMNGNPYATATKVSSTEHEHDGDWGNTQAVMALAFEQRTANLIAFVESLTGNPYYRTTREAVVELVMERLGLTGKNIK